MPLNVPARDASSVPLRVITVLLSIAIAMMAIVDLVFAYIVHALGHWGCTPETTQFACTPAGPTVVMSVLVITGVLGYITGVLAWGTNHRRSRLAWHLLGLAVQLVGFAVALTPYL